MLKVKLLRDGAKAPTVAHIAEDLGYDLYSCEDVSIFRGAVTKVRCGISVEDDQKNGFIIKDRSSMASKGVFTHAGVIDPGYRGEVVVIFSTILEPYQIIKGDKIAQMIPVKPDTAQVVVVNSLSDSARGGAGFGSSGG